MHNLREFQDQLEKLSITFKKTEKQYEVKVQEKNYTDFTTLLEKYGMSYVTRHSESTHSGNYIKNQIIICTFMKTKK